MSDSKKVSVSVNAGIGFFGLLTIVLIALKLTGQITLGWLWILAIPFIPVLIAIGIWLAIVFFALAGATVVCVAKYIQDRKHK